MAQPVAGVEVHPVAPLRRPLAVAVELRVRVARVVVEVAARAARRQLALEEAEGAALGKRFEGARRVAGRRVQVDGAAQRRAAVAQGVGAAVDLDRLGREQLERLEVGEAVGVAVGHAVHEQVDSPRVEVAPQPRPAHGDLALVGGAEAGLDVDAGRELEDVLQVRLARRADLRLGHDRGAARNAGHPVARLGEVGARADDGHPRERARLGHEDQIQRVHAAAAHEDGARQGGEAEPACLDGILARGEAADDEAAAGVGDHAESRAGDAEDDVGERRAALGAADPPLEAPGLLAAGGGERGEQREKECERTAQREAGLGVHGGSRRLWSRGSHRASGAKRAGVARP